MMGHLSAYIYILFAVTLLAPIAYCGAGVAPTLLTSVSSQYDSQSFMLLKDGFGIPSLEYQLTKSGTDIDSFAALSTDPLDTDYLACGSDNSAVESIFHYCIAYFRSLEDVQWKKEVQMTVKVQTSGGSDTQNLPYIGRNLKSVLGTPNTDISQIPNHADYVPTLGRLDPAKLDVLGHDLVPESFFPLTDDGLATGNLVTFTINYDDTASSVASLGDLSTGASGTGRPVNLNGDPIPLAKDSRGVALFYTTSTPDAKVCGFQFMDINMTATSGVGCTANAFFLYLFFEEGYQFAGFISVSHPTNAEGFLLWPLQYQLLHPRVAYYYSEHDFSTQFGWRVFWDTATVDLNKTIYDTRDSAGELDFNDYERQLTVNGTTPQLILNNALDDNDGNTIDRACTTVEITATNTDNNNNRQFETAKPFTAWTSGYKLVGYTKVEFLTNAAHEFAYTSAAHHYQTETSIADGGQCFQEMIHNQAIGFDNGFIYTDDRWLGEWLGSAPNMSKADAPIRKVEVFYDDINAGLIGLEFFDSTNTVVLRLGTTDGSAGGRSTELFPFTAIAYLAYITVGTSSSSGTNKVVWLNFYWTKAAAIWNIWTAPIANEANTFHNAEGFTYDEEGNADLQEVRFWLPFNTDDVQLDIIGSSGSEDTEFVLTLSHDNGSFARASSYAGILFNLQAQYSYNFTLYANASNIDDETSAHSEVQYFTTPNGVLLECAVNGTMKYQIEYEAIPDVAVYYEQLSETFGSSGGLLGVTTTSPSIEAAQMIYDSNEFFKRDSNYVGTKFRGFPSKIIMYSFIDNSGVPGAVVDNFIRGMFVYYHNESGSEIEFQLAGQFDDKFATGYTEFTWTLAKKIASYSYDVVDDNKLAAIQFYYAHGEPVSGGCQGPNGGTCNSTQFSLVVTIGAASDYYISDFAPTIATNQATTPGIFGLTTRYAFWDVPTLLAADRADTSNCALKLHEDMYFVRNSAYSFTFDLKNDTDFCGTHVLVYDESGSLVTTSGTERDDQVTKSDHVIVYYQIVTREQDDVSSAVITNGTGISITRASQWEASSFCYYDATGQVSSLFGVIGEDPYAMLGANQFKYKFQIALDSSYTSFYSGVPTLVLGEPVYVKISMDDDMGFKNFTVITTDCWATNDNNPANTVRYTLEEDNCFKDDTFDKVTVSGAGADTVHFKFEAFTWYVASNVQISAVYLHCSVQACPSDDLSLCDDVCAGARKRRDVGKIPRMFNKAIVSSKDPILVLSKRDTEPTEHLQILRDPLVRHYSPMFTSLASVFTVGAMTTFFTVLAAGFKIYKNKRNPKKYHILHEEPQ